jgi:hypothetical protein
MCAYTLLSEAPGTRPNLGDETQLGKEALKGVDGIEKLLLALRVGFLGRELPHNESLLSDGVLECLERSVGGRQVTLIHGLAYNTQEVSSSRRSREEDKRRTEALELLTHCGGGGEDLVVGRSGGREEGVIKSLGALHQLCELLLGRRIVGVARNTC